MTSSSEPFILDLYRADGPRQGGHAAGEVSSLKGWTGRGGGGPDGVSRGQCNLAVGAHVEKQGGGGIRDSRFGVGSESVPNIPRCSIS